MTGPTGGEGRPRRTLAIRAAVAAALAVVLTWPAALDPAGRVVGHPEATAAIHAWVMWYARAHPGEWTTDLLFFPNGADVVRLYGSDLLGPALVGRLPLPPAAAHLAWALLLLVAGGLGAARLADRLGASPGGALVALATFEAAPFLRHELLNGTTELLAAAALPWVAAEVLALLERPSAAAGARLGLAAGLGTLASVYDAFFALAVAATLVAARAAGRLDPLPIRGLVRAGLAAAAVSGALVGPAAALHLAHGAGATLRQRAELAALEDPDAPLLPDGGADLLEWFDPRPADIPALLDDPDGGTFAYWTTSTVFLGFVPLALAALAVARRRAPGGLVALLAVGVLLAAGPWLRAGGHGLRVGGAPVPGPTLALVGMLPGFELTAIHAYRYAAVALTALAALAGLGARRGAWAALVVAEALWLSPVPWPLPTTPVPRSAALGALRDAPGGEAVLVVPLVADDLGDLGRALLAQTVHHRPFQDGGIHRRAGEASTALFREVPLLQGLAARFRPALPGPDRARRDLDRLRAAGFGYVLLSRDEDPDDRLRTWLAGLLGPPAAEDAAWAWWRL